MSAAENLTVDHTQRTVSVSSLRGPILRRVSRSFYLSILFLPKKLRGPVALGYLLARASDTIADTTELPIELRSEKLQLLARGIQGEGVGNAINDLIASVAPLQKNESERALIESLQSGLDWLDQTEAFDREEVRAVLEKINRGQLLDLERFRDPKQLVALEIVSERASVTSWPTVGMSERVASCEGHLRVEDGPDGARMIVVSLPRVFEAEYA